MKTVIGLFDEFSAAESAVHALVNRGFDRADISIAGHHAGSDLDVAPGGAADVQQSDTRKQAMQDGARNGAGAGAVIGTGVGGVVGLLAGIGTIFIPGIGPIIAAGPLIATLTGAGIGAAAGAAVGSLVGALTRVGVPEHDANFYAEAVRRGGSLVMVRADDERVDDIADCLGEYGAVDVDKRRDYFSQQGFVAHDATATPYTAEQIAQERAAYRSMSTAPVATLAQDAALGPASGAARSADTTRTTDKTRVVNDNQVTVPVVEEQLKVGKRLVERGGIRIYAHVTETPVQEQVTLREQRATVERKSVDRAVDPADASAFQEQTFEVREYAEEAVVAKEARVVEEVTVGRKVEDRVETVHETVRRSDVEVEELEDIDSRMTNPVGRRVPPPPVLKKSAS